MASRGRKRKAEAALAAAAEKREKPAGSREGEVAGPSVVIEHWCAARGAAGRGSAGAAGRGPALTSLLFPQHELTSLRAQRRGPEPGAAPAGPRAGGEGEPLQAAEGQLRGAELWTGLKKGPPRKLKFPEPHVVLEELKKYLS
ncbi:hypothetical protein MJT46_010429 [Ovis ammon polii x Ovis aries]|nr:hypothetical protein MJT46_010429 [Ovis ammon polii x Ovis aries]